MTVEVADDLKVALKERLSSPIAGSFAVVWCVLNWKVLLVLFSDNGVTDTIAMVYAVGFKDRDPLVFGLMWPALLTLGYLIAQPLAARALNWWRRKQEYAGLRDRWLIAPLEFATLEEQQALQGRLEDVKRGLQEENDRLLAVVGARETDARVVSEGFHALLRDRLDWKTEADRELQVQILRQFKHADRRSQGHLSRQIGGDIGSALDRLVKAQLLKKLPGGLGDSVEFLVDSPITLGYLRSLS